MDYLLEVNDKITLLAPKTIQNFQIGAIPCEVCGHQSALNIFCTSSLSGSPFQVCVNQTSKKTDC